MSVLALYIFGGGFLCIHSLHTHRDFLFSNCGGGGSSLSSHCSSSYLQKTALPPSQWVRGIRQQPVMPQLPITCLSPAQPSSRKALFYQHHSPKHISATPNLSVEGLLGAHFALPLLLLFLCSPSDSFPESSPSSYTAFVSSFCSNERQGSARQTPGV